MEEELIEYMKREYDSTRRTVKQRSTALISCLENRFIPSKVLRMLYHEILHPELCTISSRVEVAVKLTLQFSDCFHSVCQRINEIATYLLMAINETRRYG